MGLIVEFILIVVLVLLAYNLVVSKMNSNVEHQVNNITIDIIVHMYATIMSNKLSPIRQLTIS